MRAHVLGEITLLNTLEVTSFEPAVERSNLSMKTKVSNEMLLPGESATTSGDLACKGSLARVRAEMSRETSLLYTPNFTPFNRTGIPFDFRVTIEMAHKTSLLGK